MYNYNALSVVLANAFREKGSPTQDYPAKPYEADEKPETKSEAREEQESLYALAYMTNMVQMGKHWGKK